MSAAVLDASALLAHLQNENGAANVEKYLANAMMSTVNVSEVSALLVKLGLPADEIRIMISSLVRHIVPFDLEQAYLAAQLIKKAHTLGLSLGDRACLSLAKQHHLPVITADKAWNKLDIGVKILQVR